MHLRLLVISVVLLVCHANQGFSQSPADRYFEYEQFYKASKLYEESFVNDSTNLYAAYQLAECYRRLFAYETAEKYYKIVYETDSSYAYPLVLFYYALTQKYNEHFRDAITHFDKYLTYPEKIKREKIEAYRYFDKQAIIERNGCYFALTQLSRRNKNYDFKRLPSPLNSEYNDYAPAVYQHDTSVVITSGRVTSGNPINNRFGESFEDIYQFAKTEKGWHQVERDEGFGIVNTKWADGSGTFNYEKNKYYYTSCDKKNETCRIYVTNYKNRKWQEPVLLNKNINAPKSNAKQPALTTSGDTIFFVSDREGGYGGNDIWMSVSAGGEDWGPAVNLGEKINTPANDLSPFYYAEIPILFFSSNGHEGFGGLDIYMVEGKVMDGEIINLGWPFNSSRDDLYFTFGKNAGYLSSNRDTTETKFDIFTFTKTSQQSLIDYINEGSNDESVPVAASQNNEKEKNQLVFDGLIEGDIPGMKTSVSDLSLSYSMAYKNLRSGANRFILSADMGDALLAEGNPHAQMALDGLDELLSRTELLFASENDDIQQEGVLTTINTSFIEDTTGLAMLTGELYDATNHMPVAEEIVQLANDDGEVIKITTTDKTGSFKFSNLNAQERYRVVLSESASNNYQKYYLSDVKVISYGNDMISVNFENIYFDNNVYQLRNEALLVLEELVNFYRQNPEIQIEINAYTDSDGSDIYNIELSRKRGRAAFNYLIEHGVNRTAVVMNAKGKATPVASNNNPAGKQLNRRVEFEIIGPDISYIPSTTTLVVKSGMSVSDLAKKTGTPPEELQQLNNFTTTYIPAYTPVRVKQPVSHMDEALFAGININANTSDKVIR